MKILILNGSPRTNGNTSLAVAELVKLLKKRASKQRCAVSAARI